MKVKMNNSYSFSQMEIKMAKLILKQTILSSNREIKGKNELF